MLIRGAGVTSMQSALAVVGAHLLLIGLSRRDLILPALLAGVTAGVVFFLYYAFLLFPLFPWIQETWWESKAVTIILFGVPLEEIAWATLTAALLGTLYEWTTGSRLAGFNERRKVANSKIGHV